MAENREDPVEECALRQEKVACNSMEEDEGTMLRVVSRRSTRGGDDVKWTEEVTRHKLTTPNDSSDTIAADQNDENETERGTFQTVRSSNLKVPLHSI